MSNCNPLHYDWLKTRLAKGVFTFLNTRLGDSTPTIEEIVPLIERPKSAEMGDYAIPCFNFAKTLKTAPGQIASDMAAAIESQKIPELKSCKVIGGFLNFSLDYAQISPEFLPKILDQSYFELCSKKGQNSGTRVMVEFSNPNTHKEFHIGHLRNVCLGDAICKMFRYSGFDVIPVNYLGDEGTHVAKCLWQVGLDSAQTPGDAASLWYGKQYVKANERINAAQGEAKTQILGEISQVLHAIEKKSGPYYELWQKSRQECVEDLKATYSWLGVHFDHYFFESEVSENCQQIVDEWLAKGLFIEDKGAIGIHLEDEGLGFFMARKSDGTSLYITKDLELAKRKFEDHKIHRSIYVVGNEQKFHFQQLFRVLELMGFPHAKDCFHLGYAHVTLKEGKISSRLGNAYPLIALIELLEEHIAPYMEKYKGNWSDEEIAATCRTLANAAIKYGMLQSDPQKQIVFDPTVWTSFEGNTGPYLLYSYSRARSILTKNPEPPQIGLSSSHLLTTDSEKKLLQQIYDFNSSVISALDTYKPSILCNYLYELAKAFNQFYAQAPVMKAATPELRHARCSLSHAFCITMEKGLGLIGINPAERM